MVDTIAIFEDHFRGWDQVYVRRGVSLLREPPPVPSAPDVRVSPANLSYGVPKGMSLRDYAKSENIDVSKPYFREPESRSIRCGFFPLLLRLHDGSLLAVWREASAHGYCSFGRTVVARSTDAGQSWSKPWVVFTLPDAVDAGGPENLVQTSDGTLWMGAWGRTPEQMPGTTGRQRAWAYALVSNDNGETWETLPQLGDHFYPGSPSLEMSNGEFLWRGSIPVEAEEGLTSHPASARAVMVLRSPEEPVPKDADIEEIGGLRFERFSAAHLGGPDEEHISETLIPGNLVKLMRSQGYGEHYYQSVSRDYGRTWSEAKPSGLWHSPRPSQPYLITLTDGTLVAVNDQRQNCRIVATPSFDNGRTWDVAHQQIVLDDPEFLSGDFSYPQLVEVDNGRVLCIYYSHHIDDPFAEQNGIFGNFLETRFYRAAFRGVQLAEVGSVRRASTVGYWRFDEGEGDTAHDDTGPNYGKIVGPTWVAGKHGSALEFDGRDDYVLVKDCPELRVGQEFTIEAWISGREPARTQTIVSKLPHYWFGLRYGRLCFQRGGAVNLPVLENAAETVLEADRWYHVAVAIRVTVDWTRHILFYLDGQVDGNERVAVPATAEEALAMSDWRMSNDRFWQAPHALPRVHEDIPKARPQIRAALDHLYIGLQHDLETAPFFGTINEVALHATGLLPRDLAGSLTRGRRQNGEISSATIKKPSSGWGRFSADARVPAGTAISYSVETPGGTVLRRDVSSGDSLADLEANGIRLRARLTTTDPGRTPVLWSWQVG